MCTQNEYEYENMGNMNYDEINGSIKMNRALEHTQDVYDMPLQV